MAESVFVTVFNTHICRKSWQNLRNL